MSKGDEVPAVQRRLQVGVNYTWFGDKYGLWFGPRHTDEKNSDWPQGLPGEIPLTETHQFRKDWNESFPKLLAKYKQHRISTIRLWLLGNAWNCGTGKGETFELVPLAAHNWTDAYAAHLDVILSHCKAAGMRVILVLLAHGAFFANQRAKLATDPLLREDFFNRYFEPMLTVSEGYRDTIIAWEPVNEPNWPTKYWLSSALQPLGTWPGTPAVALGDMQAFLEGAAIRIRAHGFNVTHGFSYGRACELRMMPTLVSAPIPFPIPAIPNLQYINVSDESTFNVTGPGYVRQFHYYPVQGILFGHALDFRNELPSCASSGFAFLGEISTSKPDPSRATGEPEYAAWGRLNGKDLDEESATYWRLVLSNQLGYSLVYLWPNRKHFKGDPDSGLSLNALRGIDRFNSDAILPTIP